jgi:hypothetical protein
MELVHLAVVVAQTKVVANLEQRLQAVAAELLPLVAQVELQIVVQLQAAHFLVEPVVQLAEQKVVAVVVAVTSVAVVVLIKLQLLASTVVAVVVLIILQLLASTVVAVVARVT